MGLIPNTQASIRDRAILALKLAYDFRSWGLDLEARSPHALLSLDHPFFFYANSLGPPRESDGKIDIRRCEQLFTNTERLVEESLLQKRRAFEERGHAFDFSSSHPQVSQLLTEAADYARRINGTTDGIALAESLSPSELTTVYEAFSLLQNTWPEIYSEICEFLKMIRFFEARGVIGFVDFRVHGLIFLRRDCITSAVELAEEILHESSHVRLNALLANQRLFLNSPDERFESPLRKDKRPIFGLLHQFFVLARLRRFYLLIEYEEKRLKIEAQLNGAKSILSENAKWTQEGLQFFRQISSEL